ncbi:MAG: PHP domain-containing protein [Blautia sp.]|nr:PHP domain-containing protein [Blautia sp.]MCM1200033.1 PHP domain-containing protein [Bacteroides fragilis]
MQTIPILADIHTHCIASGHGTHDTITDMARAAAGRSLCVLGLSDHGPATPGAADSSYFRNLLLAERKRFGVSLFYGAELNILNENGGVDLDDSLIQALDYAFVSIHPPTFRNSAADSGSDVYTRAGAIDSNTNAYVQAMKHPGVRFLGHPDDGRFPVDYERLLSAAKENHVYPEINNASLMPDAYRTDGRRNSIRILSLCKKMQLPVLLSSDSHGKEHIGDMRYIMPLLTECDFPRRLVMNFDLGLLYRVL